MNRLCHCLFGLFLSSLAIGVHGQDAFEWEITPEDGYPQIAFDSANADSEVIFRYNYTGTLSENKYLSVELLQFDCLAPADASLNIKDSLIAGTNELKLDLDIIQETITNSVHYVADGETKADIKFCVRVDYYYKDADGAEMSINFHETTVDISVDLTANFTLTGISTDRTAADMDEANAELDYPIHAFFCNDDSIEVTPDAFAQGSTLQVCVEIDETVEADVYVDDILRFVVSQPLGPGTPSTNIDGGDADPLTLKTCRQGNGGICNVKTQLPSKFFVNPNPNDLQIDGMALLAFGIPTATRKLVRIRGTISAPAAPVQEESRQLSQINEGRQLQEGGENPFSMEVSLVSDVTPIATPAPVAAEPAKDNTMLIIIAIVVVIVIMVTLCCCFIGIYFCMANKKKKQQSPSNEELHRYAAKMGMNNMDSYEKEFAKNGQLPPQFS